MKYDKNATSYVWNTDLQTYIDFGLIGMSGNVWEYCWNPGDTKPLVIKGGDQWNDWWKCYYFYRESYGIDNLNGTLSTGFRMVRNAQW